ncbi:hypothetical protein [Pantoea sp. C2G6]|uniref:hypothetical protein n=1 Tax=Pantoea sp. C2G6 TaxID=3243084 RepID=UPI003EDAC7C2
MVSVISDAMKNEPSFITGEQNIDTTPNGANITFRDVLNSTRALNEAHQQGTLNAAQEQCFNRKPAEELYDLQKDPWQLHNIAGDADAGPQLALFRQKLEQWRNETNDSDVQPFALPGRQQ